MKKHIPFIITICLLVTALSGIPSTAPAMPLVYEWGTQLLKVKKNLPGDKCEQFKPSEKPKYKNKIMTYITAIDAKLIEKIIIMRVKSQPMIDYLFVNDKLYTIMESWGKVDQKTEKEIHADLVSQFGQPLLQQDKNFYIYSFNNDKTKVLYYINRLPDGTSRCKVYYYTKQLFRMLIAE
jgi:hypothetical protein